MDAQAAFEGLVSSAARSLAQEGFSQRGQTLHRRKGANWQVVNFQKSVASSAQRVVFTINVGIVSARLTAFFSRKNVNKKPTSDDCHWRKRIGYLLPTQQDVWWTLDDRTKLDALITEMLTVIMHYALPVLDQYASDEQLRDLWLNEESQQFAYLAVLLKAIGPPERLASVLEEWRLAVADRPSAVLVERDIARLNEECVA
jgi:hypothetical protein